MPIKIEANPTKKEMIKMLSWFEQLTKDKRIGNKRNGSLDRKQAFGKFV